MRWWEAMLWGFIGGSLVAFAWAILAALWRAFTRGSTT